MRKKYVIFISVSLVLTSVLILPNALKADIPEFFSIALLSPNTLPARNQWALMVENTLPDIGINVSFHESTGWGNIGPRTWSYPLIAYDYIPTYAEGGYDVLFVGWSPGIDWNPTGLFDSASLVPYGDNFYQYSNPVYDSLLTSYLTELDQMKQIDFGYQLQAILYEDLPALTLIYPKSLFGFKEGLVGIDGLLLGAGADRYEFWDDPSDNVIKYAIPANLAEWNTYVQESFYDGLWMQGVYGSLFQRTQISKVWEPQIAADLPTYTADLMSMSVDINSGATFSNGDPVLAEDVVYSLQLHMTPAVGSSSYSYYNTWFATNASVYAADIDTVCFNMTDVNAFGLGTISCPIIDKSTVEPLIIAHGYSIFNEVPLTGSVGNGLVMSCGPFILSTFDPVYSVATLVPNPEYENLIGYDAPLLDQLILTYISGKDTAVAELIAGNVDIIDCQYFPLIDDFTPAGVEGILVSDPSQQEIAINMKHPIIGTGELTPVGTPTAAKYIRKAISHNINRSYIVNDILLGLGTPGVTACPEASVNFDDTLETYEYDTTLALEYMELAGYSLTTVDEYRNRGLLLISIVSVCIIPLVIRNRHKKLVKN